jgi:hypothetical protein
MSTKSKNILVLCEKLDIDFTSSGVGRSKLLRCLGQSNNSLTCVFDQFHETRTPQIEGVKMLRLVKNTNSIWLKISKFGKLSAVFHYLSGFNAEFRNLLFDWKKAIEKELHNNHYDVILVLATGQQLTTFFAISQVKTKVPYILNFHDPYPEAFHPAFERKPDLVTTKRYKIVQKLVEKSLAVTTPAKLLLEHLNKYYKILAKGVVLPHPGISTSAPRQKNDKLSIVHTGLLFGQRNPIYLLEALQELIAEELIEENKIHVDLIGPSKLNETTFQGLIDALKGVVNYSTDRISYQESLVLQESADVLLLIDFDIEESPIMLGKLADYFALNKPILALSPLKSETTRLLGKDYPYQSPVSNKPVIKKVLIQLYNDWKSGQLAKVNLDEQQAYVSCQNINHIFNNQVLSKL